MAKKDDIDFALFADSLISEDIKELKANKTSLIVDPQKGIIKAECKDISKVVLNEDTVDSLLSSFGDRKLDNSKPKQPVKTVVKEEKRDISELIKEFESVMAQAKKLLTEMTSCGSIGVATIEPSANPKKKKLLKRLRYGLKASNKRS